MQKQRLSGAGRLANGIEVAIWAVGLALIGWIVAAVFGLVSHGADYYVNFAIGIVAMSGLLALSELTVHAREGHGGPGLIVKAVLAVAATISGLVGLGYFRINIEDLVLNAPFFDDTAVAMGYFTIFSVIVLTWLHWGWLLASLSALAILYFYFGQHIPIGLLQHPGYTEQFIMNYVALNTNQGFFQFIGVAADDVYLLIIFGVTLLGVGMLRMMIEVGLAAGTRVKGGAALPAVLGSAAIGSVMGQAVSNVVLTGRLTIPMMKKYRYDGAMAGAIEATASSVGQIMPPVLGLAGFLIASFLGMPYITVALAALIPALLYMVGVSFSVAVYALREDLPKLQESIETPLIWRMLPTLLISFGAVIWLLLGFRSPGFAALVGIVLALGLALLQGKYRPRFNDLKAALREGLFLTTILSLLIMAIGPLGQVMITSNLSGRLAILLARILPDIELLLLVGAMILSMILGMGLPTPIAYVVASLAMVPFLQELGVQPLLAHFFVFYFAVFSTLTPPIAVSVLAASKLADASFGRTAVNALKIAGTTFIIPFAFVFNPSLLSFPAVDATVIMPIVEVVLTQFVFAMAAYGYCFKRLNAAERFMFAVVAVIGYWTLTTHGRPVALDMLLIASFAAAVGWCLLTARRNNSARSPELKNGKRASVAGTD